MTKQMSCAALAAILSVSTAGHVLARAKGKPAAVAGKKDKPATRELEGSCSDSDGAALWWSPLAPAVGHPMKIMAVGDGAGDLTVTDPQGDEKALTTVR